MKSFEKHKITYDTKAFADKLEELWVHPEVI